VATSGGVIFDLTDLAVITISCPQGGQCQGQLGSHMSLRERSSGYEPLHKRPLMDGKSPSQ